MVLVSVCSSAFSGLRTPNRGKQLFLVIEERRGPTRVVAMNEPSRLIIQEWNRYNPTYDFISAVVTITKTGCKVDFIRYVMKDDYMPREEHVARSFPYTEQLRSRLFDFAYITGFYRNSIDDIDDQEFRPR
jgi:hypothetical protein